jgi:chromosome partitioning protein
MMLIIIANTKGGVGKSTIAVHLAIWLFDQGCNVALLDTDEQGTAKGWLSTAEPNLPTYAEREPNKLVSLTERLKKQYEFVVCDTEGSYGFVGTLLPSLADLAIVPLQPSEADVDELDKALFHIQVAQASKGTPHAVLVLNMTAPNDAKSNRLRTLLKTTPVPVAKHTIRRLNATRDAAKRGVVTRGNTSQCQNAGSDFERLFTELLQDYLPRRPKRVGNG